MPKGLILTIALFLATVLIYSNREDIADFFREVATGTEEAMVLFEPSYAEPEAMETESAASLGSSSASDPADTTPRAPEGPCDFGNLFYGFIGENLTGSAKIQEFGRRCIGDLNPHVQPMPRDMRDRFGLDYDLSLTFREVGITVYLFEDRVVRLGFHSGAPPQHGGASDSQRTFVISRFDGTLPHGLDFSDLRAQVEEKIGEGRRDEWGRHGLPCKSIWDGKGIEVRYQFENHRRADNEILSIDIFQPQRG